MVVGRGNNTKASFLAFWGLLWFTRKRGIFRVKIYGDLRVVIDWTNAHFEMHTIHLEHWLDKIHVLIEDFVEISFEHIYRELNMQANFLSKNVIGPMDGHIFFE